MDTSYIAQGTKSDIQVTGPTTVQDVVVIAATTAPSGVYFELPVATTAYKDDGGASSLALAAGGIEWLATYPNVSAVVYAEDLDASGLLASYLNATVTIPTPPGRTGPFSLLVPVLMNKVFNDAGFQQQVVAQLIDDAVALLQASAGVAPPAPPPPEPPSG